MRKFVSLPMFLLAFAGARLQAQACVGAPAGDGNFTLAPAFRLQQLPLADHHTYGLDATANLPGRLGIEGGYGYTRVNLLDFNQHTLRVRPSLELVQGKRSVCAVAGAEVSYRRYGELLFGTDATGMPVSDGSAPRYRELIVPVGVGLGVTTALAGSGISLYTLPQALFIRYESWLVGSPDGRDWRAVQTARELGIEGGARVRLGPVTGRVAYLHTGWAGLRDVWTFSLGYARGR